MIIKHTSSPVITSDNMSVSKMGIDPNNSDFLGMVLRSKIYSNKILAPVREYICNCYDAAIESGTDKTCEVKITNHENETYIFSVRDYGYGLSENDVRNVFGMYGASSKRSTNKQVGMFGVGGASAMAYTDSFTIRSYHNGLNSLYCATLSAGDQLVEVSNMYLISEEPTTETGIEISIDVTKDYWKFHDETKKFVSNFLPGANIQYEDWVGNIHTPNSPILIYEKSGYVINAYSSVDYYKNDKIWIRMGGVIYEYNHRHLKYGRFINQLIVDVPIGKLTIPISRESLEDTPNNQRVLKEIDEIIVEIYENDKKSLTVPKFGEYISNPKSSRNYEGVWCDYNISDLFPDTNKFRNIVQHTHKMYDEAIKPNANAKYIIYTFPEIRTYKSWVKRLEAVLTTDPDYSGYLAVFNTANVMTNYSKNTETLDVSDCIFVDVKSLGLPKLVTTPKDKDHSHKQYIIYNNVGKDYKTIDGHDEDTDSEIYKDADWFKSEELTYKQFFNRCIGWTNSSDDHTGHGHHNRFWTTGAKKMYDGLVTLGFIEVGSQIYKDTLTLIDNRQQKQNDMDQAQSRIMNATFKVGSILPQLVNAVGKNSGKLDRLIKVKKMILGEDSPRSRILKQIENSYSYCSTLTRSDLRMILKMK